MFLKINLTVLVISANERNDRMKVISKAAAIVTAACMMIPYIGNTPQSVCAATTVTVSPNNTYEINKGIFEGWGTSLCWWANRVGYSDSLAQKCADTFYGEDGLRLNIARLSSSSL